MIASQFLSETATQQLALTLIHFVWQGIVIATLVASALSMTRRQRPPTRYAICLFGLVAMVVCPVVTFQTIRLDSDASVVNGERAPSLTTTERRRPFILGGDEANVSFLLVPERGIPIRTDSKRELIRQSPLRLNTWPRVQLESWLAATHTSITPILYGDDGPTVWLRLQPWIVSSWIVGVFAISIRLLFGWIGVLRLRRQVEPAPEWMRERVQHLAESLRVSRPFIQLSHRVTEAVAIGFLKPMILLPVSWATELTPDMIEAVIVHELAHICRGDLWVNLLQRLVEALLFYHPAVWWLSQRMRIERELCCDELVIRVTQNPLRYAETLEYIGCLNLAESRHRTNKAAAFSLPIGGHQRILLKRIRAVLKCETREDTPVGWLAGMFSMTLAGLIAGSLISRINVTASDESERIKPNETGSFKNQLDQPVSQDVNLDEESVVPRAAKQVDDAGNGTSNHREKAEEKPDLDDDLFIVIQVGQKQQLEFEKQILRINEFEPTKKFLEITGGPKNTIQIKGVSAGLTILTFVNENGTEFSTAVEVVDQTLTSQTVQEPKSIKLKPRRSPQQPLLQQPANRGDPISQLVRLFVLKQPPVKQQTVKSDHNKLAFVVRKDRVQYLEFDERIGRLSGIDPEIIDVGSHPATPNQLRVTGLSLGKNTFIVETVRPNGLLDEAVSVDVEVIEPEGLTRDEVRKLFADNKTAKFMRRHFQPNRFAVIVMRKGWKRNLEFDDRLIRVDEVNKEYLNVTAIDLRTLQIEGLSAGSTSIAVTDIKGTKFHVHLFVRDSNGLPQPVNELQTIKPNPRPFPQRRLKINRDKVSIVISKGRDLDLDFDAKLNRVDDFDPEVVNVVALTPTSLRIRGLSVGKTTFIAQGDLPDSPEKQFAVEIEVAEIKDLTKDDVWKLFDEDTTSDK